MLSIARLYTCSATRLIYPYTKNFLVNGTPQTLISGGLGRHSFKLCHTRNALLKNFKLSRLFSEAAAISVRLKSDAVAKYKKAIGYWLLTSSGMVFVAVILGGVTRLTESGLSMVTWKLLGEKMPKTADEWEREFLKYQEFPEFQIQRRDMTLREFKFIWFMEYTHRMWGRAIGAAFLLPATFFWMRGAFTNQMKVRVVIFGGLILAQGLMGWYMVKSGLENKREDDNSIVRVSQYRLASHLSLALVLYSLLLWSSFDHLLPAETVSNLSQKAIKSARNYRMIAHSCKGMVFLTAIAGAFVAGLDGGLVYNSFPKMADKWIPDDILAYTPTLSNFTENPTTVQFDHRILGVTTLALISTLWLLSRRRKLPRRAYLATNALTAMAWIQVALGITTLLMYVPVPVAASHQSGSLVLLSTAIWLTHELKRLPKI